MNRKLSMHMIILLMIISGNTSAAVVLATSVLPASRSVQVGQIATAFAAIINAGDEAGTQCSPTPLTTLTSDYFFQTTNPATNALTGTRDQAVDIAAGATQTFVFGFTPTAEFAPVDVQFTFSCTNSSAAGQLPGINTLLLSASNTPVPDIIALAATASNDGFVVIPAANNTGAFAVATANVGSAANISASADSGSATLPVTISMCQTNPTTGACINPTTPTTAPVVVSVNALATPTFAVFVAGTQQILENAATSRIFVRFKDDNDITRGSTSVAVKTEVVTSSTTLTVTELQVPTANADYASGAGGVVISGSLPFTLPDDTVSFLLQLTGTAVNATGNATALEIAQVNNPQQTIISANKQCSQGLCAVLTPQIPQTGILAGQYTYQLQATVAQITDLNLADASLSVAVRRGPQPDLTSTSPGTLSIRPFLSGASSTVAEIDTIMAQMVTLAATYGITVLLDPVVNITDPKFASVSDDFNNATTAEMISMGAADKINLFFVEALTGAQAGGTLGIAGGLPGVMGKQSRYNGVLMSIDAHKIDGVLDINMIDKTSMHEIGHYLGLFHTTEMDFAASDIIADTPDCTVSQDSNGNGVAEATECADGANLMFWGSTDDTTVQDQLTTDQKNVLYFSPVARP